MKRLYKIFFFSSLVFLLSSFTIAQKASFVKEVSVDESTYIIWGGYVIDSTYWHVWNADGTLPKRANGTYKYWKEDNNGELIRLRKIDYRLPIFKEQSIVMKKEENIFNNKTIEQ